MMTRILQYNDGERIISAGNMERRMYIILEGLVEISLSEGQQKIILATVQKGNFFGEISLFNNRPRSANVDAKGDVKLTYIDNVNQLNEFLVKNSMFAAKMVHILANRLAKTDELLLGKVNEINRIKTTSRI